MVLYTCQNCLKEFKKKDDFIKHTERRKYPCNANNLNNINLQKITEINNKIPVLTENKNEHTCDKCNKSFVNIYSLKRHCDNYCKVKKEKEHIIEKTKNNQVNIDELDIDDKTKIILTILMNQNKKIIDDMKEQMNQNKKIIDEMNLIKNKIKFDEEIQNDNNKLVNDKLIDIIINKNEKIKELKNDNHDNITSTIDDKIDNNLDSESNNEKPINLTINNHIIMFRETDKYINATQLCKAGDKKFNDWFRLDNTKELISMLESNAGIPALNLVEKKIGGSHEGTFIHPDLAIQLAQWINPHFALQVSSWIRTLFTKGKVNIKLLKEQENKINKSTKKIKILEDMVLKKQKRTEYPESNVIYLLTTEDHKKRRTYILGKAKNLTTRLGTYNKTCDHEVIYYKACKTEKHMDLSEEIILLMLEEYREVANRDRFVLPVGEDIKFFTDIINKYC
jgi:hypothetical protein